ncbi:MAG TPA: type II secretion system major pseudopilin GspG [Smithella sp.]|nr:type II secretion system major pseudopilin GspG [Smithella sp.]
MDEFLGHLNQTGSWLDSLTLKIDFFKRGKIMTDRKLHNGRLINSAGFTLIEILVVVIIIGFIASLIAPNIMGRFERSKEEIAKAQVDMLSSGVMSFKVDMNRYPAKLEELIQSKDSKWRGPYLSKQTLPKDPWDRDYLYKAPGEHGAFDLYSLGPDGILGEKSIKNW